MPVGIPGLDAIDRQRAAENFPVALRVLPRAVRTDLIAIYGFARLVDDIGDEYEGDRVAALDWLEHDLDAAVAGAATHPVLVRLTPTIRRRHLDLQPFRDLIEANRRDQTQTRYATLDDLLDYCRLSANPVGRLVLAVFDVDDPESRRLSDDVCSALQVVEHLQDVAEDWRAGRVYLPQEDLATHGCSEADLAAGTASPALRQVVALECERARQMLHSGRPLTKRMRGWARITLAGFVAGGEATIDAIEAARFDVLGVDCRPQHRRVARHATSLLVGRAPA